MLSWAPRDSFLCFRCFLRLHFWCWIEFSLQRELDLAFLQDLGLGPLLGARWTHVHFLFVAISISGVHLVPLWAHTEASFVSLDALCHSQRITARPRVTFCSFLAPICCPWGLPLGTMWHQFLCFRHAFIAHSREGFCSPSGVPSIGAQGIVKKK